MHTVSIIPTQMQNCATRFLPCYTKFYPGENNMAVKWIVLVTSRDFYHGVSSIVGQELFYRSS